MLALFWFGLTQPAEWMWVVIGLIIVPVLAVVVMRQSHWRIEYIGLSVASVMLLLSAYTFTLIQESQWIIYGVVVVALVFYYLFTQHLAVFLFQPAKYVTYSLEHVSKYSNVVASFFLYVSLFIFLSLGIVQISYIMAVMAVVTAVLVWQTLWIQKVPWNKARLYALAITIVMIEGFWALHFWPTSFFVNGAILAIALYLLLHLTRHFLTDTLTRKLSTRYIVVSAVAVALLLATAQWVY